MKIVNLADIDKQKVIDFCENIFLDKSMPANKNMDINDWEDKSNTLLHALFIQNRFSKENRAEYLFIEKDDKYIAGSGMYQLNIDKNICIIATRTYTLKSERAHTLHSKFTFPLLLELAKNYGYKSLILTFNEYNLWLKQAVEKVSSGSKILGNRPRSLVTGWTSLNFPVEIQYTKQWVLYKHLDETYERDFINTMAKIRTS